MIKDEFTVAYHEGEESIRIDKYLPTCYEDMTRSELKKYFDEIKLLIEMINIEVLIAIKIK